MTGRGLSGSPALEGMRIATRRVLAADAEPPSTDELQDLQRLYRGAIQQLIPRVEDVAFVLPRDDVPRACALAGIGEARRRLDEHPAPGLPAGIAHAQRLARSVNALLDHAENLRLRVPA